MEDKNKNRLIAKITFLNDKERKFISEIQSFSRSLPSKNLLLEIKTRVDACIAIQEKRDILLEVFYDYYGRD